MDPSLFSLESLQHLDLSGNSLGDYSYNVYQHQKFDRFTSLTHLNLSNSGLVGQIPIGISKLISLVSLDISSRYDGQTTGDGNLNNVWVHNFQTLVANLSNLRELYLDEIQIMSSSGEEWGKVLAKSVPHLQVLSLRGCGLNGHLHHSFASLLSLVSIDLGYNDIPAGPVPEFFANFLNLSVLQLSDMNLEGWFPQRFFRLRNLRVLDLSSNPNLSGHLPNFSCAGSLETLRLEGTNFSYVKASYSSNVELLRELTLDGKFLSVEFLSSFGVLWSLCQLKVALMDSQKKLGSILSWIGDMRNLTSLELCKCEFSWTVPSSIANLKVLRSLKLFDCNLPRPILSEIGNLVDLQNLEISGMDDCKLHGSLTSSIGNLTNLRSLRMVNCEACGSMPDAIGYLRKLQRLEISSCEFTGAIPSAIGNLSNLKTMVISARQFSGQIPYSIGQLKELTWLTIQDARISGRMPSSVVNLTRLVQLEVSYTYLSGEIPAFLFALPALRFLSLDQNQLSGPIEEFDAAASCLVSVGLSHNGFTGQFPKSFFRLASLSSLRIDWNNFAGSVDLSSFWKLRKLTALDLSHNNLSVMVQEGNYSPSTSLPGLTETCVLQYNQIS